MSKEQLPCAVVIAGGFGTRLEEAGYNTHKALFGPEGFDIFLADLAFDQLVRLQDASKLGDVGVITTEKFHQAFKDYLELRGLTGRVRLYSNKVLHKPGKGALNDLIEAIEVFEFTDRDVLVAVVDTYFEFSFDEILEAARQHPDSFITVLREFPTTKPIASRLGCAVVGEESNGIVEIKEFVEKPDDPPSTYAAIPYYFYRALYVELLRQLVNDPNIPNMVKDAPGNIIPHLLKLGKPIHALVTNKITADLGKPPDIKRIIKLLTARVGKMWYNA